MRDREGLPAFKVGSKISLPKALARDDGLLTTDVQIGTFVTIECPKGWVIPVNRIGDDGWQERQPINTLGRAWTVSERPVMPANPRGRGNLGLSRKPGQMPLGGHEIPDPRQTISHNWPRADEEARS